MFPIAPNRRGWTNWVSSASIIVATYVAVVGAMMAGRPAMSAGSILAVAIAILAQAAALRFRQANRMVYLGWGEAALIVVAFLLPSGWVPATIGAGAVVGQMLYRLRTGTAFSQKIICNGANLTLAGAVGTLVAHAIAGSGITSLTPRTATGLVVGSFAYGFVGVCLVNLGPYPSLSDYVRANVQTIRSKAAMVLGNVTLGVSFVAIFVTDRRWLLIMPAVLLLAYQAYVFQARAGDERRTWREFSALARSLHQADEPAVAVAAVNGIQTLFVAAAVEIWVDRLGGAAWGYRAIPVGSRTDVTELTGHPVDHPVPPSTARALAIGGTRVGEIRLWMAAGSTLETRDHMAMSAVCEAVAAALHDAAAHRALRTLTVRSFQEADRDVLTGIRTRATLVRDGTMKLGELPPEQAVAMFLFGIDRFKDVNDSLGHPAGDDLLRVTASRLAAFARPGDLAARLSGDKFALLVTHLDEASEASAAATAAVRRATDLAAQLAVPTEVAGLHLAVEVSIGVVVEPAAKCDLDELLRRADVAMYDAKSAAGVVAAYDVDTAAGSADRRSLLLDLRSAMDCDDQLIFDVQPVLDLDTGAPIAAEALIRWQHPEHGLLAPSEFIDLVDASDLIGPFTRYVLDRSLAMAGRWRAGGLSLPVSVNLSPHSLTDAGLPADIAVLLRSHEVTPGMLILEITESAVADGHTVVDEVLSSLRAMGVQLAVDDFGTGYSTLTFLTKVQVDEVKVDSSFVGAMMSSPSAAAIVRTTVDLARRLGLRVVAEGVETEAQRTALRALGCGAAQGWHLAPPIGADRIIEMLRELITTAIPDRAFPLEA